jgi:hypothetical protein
MSKTTKKEKKTSSTASAFTSVAAQLLLRRGGRLAANNGDSTEFFSDLRKCQPEPRVSAGEIIDRDIICSSCCLARSVLVMEANEITNCRARRASRRMAER